MMKYILLVLSLAYTMAVFSQEKKIVNNKCSCAFQSINQAGLLEGEKGSAFQLQTINGVEYNSWYAGIGAGIDYYRFRSVPLFLDIRKYLLKKSLSPFLYSDIGVHFPWKRDGESLYVNGELSSGWYYDVGLGLKIASGNKQGFNLSAGYSYKNIRETSSSSVVCIRFPCEQFRQTRNYGLNRLTLKLGWMIRN